MRRILILYPHGLGDCILLTPAIREFFMATENKVSIATLQRFKSATLFDNNPYVDQIFYTKDAWADYPASHIGFQSLYSEWKQKAKDLGFHGFLMPMHSQPTSKILLNCEFLGIRGAANYQPEVHTTPEDVEKANEIIQSVCGDSLFGFVQTNTGVPQKDLPAHFGRNWLKGHKGLDRVIEIGTEFGPLEYNINVQFEIMRRASAVCLPDSVFYHACHAMGKDVDFAFFGRGKQVYDRVKPLHKVTENIVFDLKGVI